MAGDIRIVVGDYSALLSATTMAYHGLGYKQIHEETTRTTRHTQQ